MVNADLDSHHVRIIASVWTLFALSGACIVLRLVGRSRRRTRLWWDDWIIILSWVTCLGVASASITHAAARDLGRHIQDVDAGGIGTVLLFGATLAAILTIAASVWSKVSFALSLLRISSSGCTEITRRTIWVVIISLNVMLVISTAMLLASCRPMQKIWKPELEGECWSNKVRILGAIVVAAYSGVTDLILAFLPWKIIWCLPIVMREKVSLVVVMSLGAVAGVASFVKCAQIHLMITDDFTYDSWTLIFWSFFEPTLTIVAASMPILRILFRDQLRTSLGWTRDRRNAPSDNVENANSGATLSYLTSPGTGVDHAQASEAASKTSREEVFISTRER